uniref:MFS domain-containing protein n=1 Tax=Elaeophora elaphi TaxID=1147741 RepID=A0A0R3RJH8_9BILA
MPKSPHLGYCCFVNNIRYLVLLLLIACVSVLFANIILYSVAVIYDDYQDTQLWTQTHLTQSSSTERRRFLRSAINDNSLNISDIRSRNLKKMLEVINSNSSETVDSHETNNVTFTAGTLLLDTNVNEEIITTISFLSRSIDIDIPAPRKYEGSERLTYKNGRLQPDKDRQWDDNNLKDDGEKSRQQVEMEGIAHRTLNERMQHFLVWTAPGVGMFCGSFSTSWFLRSFGSRRFFALMMMISAVATALLAMTPQIKYGRYLTACMRFIQGLVFASAFPMIGSVIANWGTLKHQFLFLICCTSFTQLAPLISWPISSYIFTYDYRTPFLVHAALTCLLALVWLVIFREKPQYHFSVNGLELNKIVAGKIKAEHNRILAENPCRLLITSFPVWAIWIAACGYFLVVSVVVQFLPLYCLLIVRETRTDSALLSAVPFLFVFIVTQFHGLWYRLAKLFSERRSILVFNTTSFVICSLIFVFLAIFPPGGTFHHSVVAAFTLILCILSFSVYGFYRSAVLVGRFFGQFIVSYIRFFIGFAFFFTAIAAVFFVEENNADEWRVIFLILAALLLISAAVFGIFGSALPEEWSKDMLTELGYINTAVAIFIITKMEYVWRSIVTITLLIEIGSVCAEEPIPINFTATLIETVQKFQLQGRLFALHISYIALGLLSVLFTFGLSIVLLSEHQWCKKKEEEDTKTMELVPHDIFEVHYPNT